MLQHTNLNLTCMEVPKDDYTKEGLQMMAISSLYVLNKIMDLLDTVCCTTITSLTTFNTNLINYFLDLFHFT